MPSSTCTICGGKFNTGLYTRQIVGMRKANAIDKCLDACYAQVRTTYAQVKTAEGRLRSARAQARKLGYRGPSYR